ncbi:MAG TPA: LysR family transcriptional regulator [Solirubrobacterales bacterium]|nr:LysR family transcriptional regulator [Solirubrobacterales bacterium]
MLFIIEAVVLRQLEYLSALAEERHFGRAAAACHITQPALSVAIRKLEAELGVELVQRGRTYDDLTPQGHELLRWARQTLASVDGLVSAAARLTGELSGRLRLGVIPTALPAVAEITAPLLGQHPNVDLEVRSLSSTEIGAQLESFRIDAGVTYLDNEPLGRLRGRPLYEERYVYLSPDGEGPDELPWASLDGASLCLLSPEMQNRRIVEAALERSGAKTRARIESNSISALLSFARAGWSSIVSETWLSLYGVPEGMRAVSLVAPEVGYTIGIVTRETELLPPVVGALLESAPVVEGAQR